MCEFDLFKMPTLAPTGRKLHYTHETGMFQVGLDLISLQISFLIYATMLLCRLSFFF